MTKFSGIVATISSFFQIGLTGPRLKNASGNLEIRNSGDTANVDLTAATITGSTAVKSPIISYSARRQSILSGSIDATTRQANALSIGTGLIINLAATSTNLILSFGAGRDQYGLINVVGTITADTTFSSLTANQSVIYLYVDRNTSNGTLTTGFSLLQPVSKFAYDGTPSTDQHWFDESHNEMKRWNGSAWVTVQRVFIGQCVTGASTVTSVINYPHLSVGDLYEWHFDSRAYEQKIRTAGGTISDRRLKYVDSLLVKPIYELGIRSQIRFLMPFASDTFTGSNQTLYKNSGDSEPSFVNLNSGSFYNFGIVGDGSTSYINTNHSLVGYTTGHLLLSISEGRRTFRNGGNWAIGCEQSSTSGKFSFGGSGGEPLDYSQWNNMFGDTYFIGTINGTANTRFRTDELVGEHIQTRNGTAIRYFYNRRNYVSTTTGSGFNIPTIPPFIMAANYNGTAGDYNFLTYRGVSFGDHLTTIEATNYQQIWTNFRTAFN